MLKINILVNYISQIYIAAIGIILLPFYIKYMGSEAYGLIGFFSILQAWFNVLDLGLTPTISRETARYKGNALSSLSFRRLLRALTIIFISIAIIGSIGLLSQSENIALHWLKIEELPIKDVIYSIQIMSICVALRWVGGLYRGIISGSERIVTLSIINIVISTLRFVVVIPVMFYYGFKPTTFFSFQLIVAIIEFIILLSFSLKEIPFKGISFWEIGFSFKPIINILKFSLSIAFTSIIWILITQVDKFILSGILSLSEYGYFSLAVLVASGVLIVSGPVSTVIMPRMTRLNAENKNTEVIQIYKKATRIISVIAGSATITIAFFPNLLLYAWTGDATVTDKTTNILQLYTIGNGMLVLSSFPYYLQYAKGNLRYHIIGNIVMATILIPTIIVISINYGSTGAGYTWLGVNILFLFLWVHFVHEKIAPNIHKDWFFRDIIYILVPMIIVSSCIKFFILDNDNYSRLNSFLLIVFVGLINLSCAILSSINRSKLFSILVKSKKTI